MVPASAGDVIIIAVFIVAALVITLQWVCRDRLARQAAAGARAIEEMRALLDQAPLGVALLDRKLRYIYINKPLAEINGVAASAHLGRSLHEIVPSISDDAEAQFSEVIATGKPVLGLVFQGVTAARPGVIRTWRESVFPRLDRHGEIIGVAVSVEEITEQQRLLEALHTSETLERRRAGELESVLEAVPAAVFIAHDRACEQVSANLEAVRLLRLRPNESPSLTGPGKRPFEVRADGVPVPVAELPLQRAAATGQEVRGRALTVHFEDGDVIHVQMNAVPLHDHQGGVIGAVASFVDVTDAAVMADELRRDTERKVHLLEELAASLRASLAAASDRTGLPASRAEAGAAVENELALALRRLDASLAGAGDAGGAEGSAATQQASRA